MPHRIIKRIRQSPRATLRLRLTLWIAAIFTLMQWGVATVYWLYLRSMLDEINNATVVRLGASVAAQIAPGLPDFDAGLANSRSSPTYLTVRFDSVFIEVFDPSGRRVHESIPAVVDAPSLPIADALQSGGPLIVDRPQWAQRFAELPEPPSRLRTVLIPVEGGDGLPYVVLVAISDGFARPQVAMVNSMLFTSVAINPILSVLVAWFMAGVAVAPLLRLRELAQQLSPDRLGQSIQFEPDSTEVSQLAQQLEDARARLHKAFAAQERFLSNVSHEIKTPIAVMGIEAQTLDLTGATDDIVYFVGSVREESRRLGNLVESFLTLSRIQDGKAPTHARSYAANDLVMDSVEHCAVMAQQNIVHLAPSLFDDEALMEASVAGDPELLTTMLDNLIRNAIRFSPRHGLVRVGLACDQTTLFVQVADEGPGIPPEKLPTVFDRFAQVGNEKRAGRGHGLGLSIAMGIAELHGGTIRVRNLEQAGCEFTIELPRCDTPQADTPCPDNQSDDHPDAGPTHPDSSAAGGPEREPGGVSPVGG